MKITPYANNAKKHPPKQIEQIANSIKEFGMNQPIVVDKNGVIIVGHGRYEAMKLLGMEVQKKHVITVDLTEEQAKAYRLADNKLNESDWEMKKVVEELKEMSLEMLDLTGFSRDLIIEHDDQDDVIPEDAPSRTKLGDIYQLGPHRVLCGDSTRKEALSKLMDGKKADMVFTDPPYNVDYSGSGKKTSGKIMNDKMTNEQFDTFLVEAFKRIHESIKKGAGCYVFHSHKTASDFEMALERSGFIIDTQLIWNKPSAGMGMNHYRTKHEPFFYCSVDKNKVFYGDHTGTTVWKVPKGEDRAFQWFQKEVEAQERGGSTVWSMSRANVNDYVHPTQKPVELVVIAMSKSSKEEDIVLDPFLGSGTTLISAEKANRVCYGMELDPRYVDVIVQRYVDYTGNEDVQLNGKTILWKKTKEKTNEEEE